MKCGTAVKVWVDAVAEAEEETVNQEDSRVQHLCRRRIDGEQVYRV